MKDIMTIANFKIITINQGLKIIAQEIIMEIIIIVKTTTLIEIIMKDVQDLTEIINFRIEIIMFITMETDKIITIIMEIDKMEMETLETIKEEVLTKEEQKRILKTLQHKIQARKKVLENIIEASQNKKIIKIQLMKIDKERTQRQEEMKNLTVENLKT